VRRVNADVIRTSFNKKFKNLDRVFILRAILAAMGKDMYAKDWQRVMVDDQLRDALPSAFEIAKKAIRRALDFLEPLGVRTDRLLPYGLQLVLLAEFFRECPQPTEAQSGLLKRWFWMTSFTTWFGGVNTAQVRAAQQEMQALARGELVNFKLFNLDETAKPFPSRFDARSARVRAFLLYLVTLKPMSLLHPEDKLATDQLLSEFGPGALAQVVSRLDDEGLSSSPANRMFVDRESSGQAISALRNISDDSTLQRVLGSHGFPDTAVDLVRGNEESRRELVAARLAHLIVGERQFLEQCGVVASSDEPGDVLADSDASGDAD